MKQKAKKLIHTIHQMEQIKNNIITHKDNVLVDLDQFPIGICIVSKSGDYVRVNRTYAEMYGYTKEEMLGQSFTLVKQENEKEKSLKEHHELIERNFNDKGIISEEVGKEGEVIPVAYISCNIYRMTGEAERIYFVTEISDINQAEHQVDEAYETIYGKVKVLEEKLKSQELAENIFMHDLKKPIRNIQGICQILMESGQLSPEENTMWVEQIMDLSEKIITQAEIMRGINRMERGVYEPVLKQVELVELLDRMKVQLTPVLNSKEIELVLNLEKGNVIQGNSCLMADEPYIEMMLSNLVTNAIEASPENEKVIVDLKEHDGWVHIHIVNKGTVPKEIRNQFFEKYITKGKDRGTGLGTYIARLIASSIYGDIYLDTTKVGETTVTVSLPLAECKSQAA